MSEDQEKKARLIAFTDQYDAMLEEMWLRLSREERRSLLDKWGDRVAKIRHDASLDPEAKVEETIKKFFLYAFASRYAFSLIER